MAAKLAAALVLASIAAAVTRSSGVQLTLSPDHVLTRLALWQPFTYIFLEASPLGVLFGALILWSIGGALEAQWGPRRLLTLSAGVAFVSGLLTVGLAAAIPLLRPYGYYGGMVMTTAVWIAYGLSFGTSQVSFWGVPVTGNAFAAIGGGLIVLSAAFSGWQWVIPEAIGALLTLAALRLNGPKLWVLRFQSWRLQRQLKGRSKHLKVIAQDRNTSRSSDRFLH